VRCASRRDRFYLADPYARILLPKSINATLADEATLNGLWPDHPDWRGALRNGIAWTPAYPQDYCPRNQYLQHRLEAVLGDRCPRFGVDPLERMQTYADLRRKNDPSAPPADMRLWD